MKAEIENALYELTGTRNLQEANIDELFQLENEYPYFAPGQFLLAARLKLDDHPASFLHLSKTSLLFSNPFWLQYQLTNDSNAFVPMLPEEQPAETHTSLPVEEIKIPVELEEITEIEMIEDLNPEEELQTQKFASVLSEQVADFKKPAEKDSRLEFESEPYYMIDYFASQGIKADLTKLPQDKLSKQLLSFTDWLKQLKNTSPELKGAGPATAAENAIQDNAQVSNETKEIVTETMAEVLAKQGKTDKAIQLYIKLSFLDPEKTAYFAAKIEQLKGM